ncbi:MAG: CotH kinase family protein [Oscillospiraceae bacterium]|nr:CotH kinase family protein [Oscillospiraceae bacterium]
MSASKKIDKIGAVIVALTLVLAFIFCNGQALGLQATAHAIGYENRLFDKSKVHTFDIVINDWDAFLETCESETYTACNVVIDGEAVRNVGIRGKGNTSLSSVKNMDSSRYSFKVEFDQYDNTQSYHGLDKLCLNNIIQDNTYMKDYLAYTLMYDFRVDSPLCSYVYITVNGEDWGLYLAVEAIEDSFLERNYGSNYGDLYKPDSMSFGGGGPGNGKDFKMSEFAKNNGLAGSEEDTDQKSEDNSEKSGNSEKSSKKSRRSRSSGDDNSGNGMPDFGNMPDMGDFVPSQFGNGNMPDFGNGGMPDFSNMPDMGDFDPSQFGNGEMPDMGGFGGGKGGFGMGSSDVKLQYTDDEESSYTNIFNNAKTTVNTADKKRLIQSLKSLSEQSDLENTVDVEEVIRYFVVHNFLCNGDSYTGQMIHNYYLYEEDGQLSMIPWDYNLAYGSFQGSNAKSSVNSPIDTPVSGGMSDRTMVSWIFDNEEYTEQYHELFEEFIGSVDFEKLVNETAAMIDEYVEKDPTKFCTYDDFKTGVEAIREFCTLRAESVSGQLDGTIPSTSDGQSADSSALIDTGDLNISDMGTMNMGGGKGGFGGFGGRNSNSDENSDSNTENSEKSGRPSKGDRNSDNAAKSEKPSKNNGNSEDTENTDDSAVVSALSFSTSSDLQNITLMSLSNINAVPLADNSKSKPQGFGGGNMPEDFDPENMPGGFEPGNMPGGFSKDNIPSDFDPENMPEGFEPGNMPEGFSKDDMPSDFDPENIPEGFSKKDADDAEVTEAADIEKKPAENAASEEKTSENKSDEPSAEGRPEGAPDNMPGGNGDSDSSRPEMGNFPSMGGSGPNMNELTQYIFVGASALILIFGLAFAIRFKR